MPYRKVFKHVECHINNGDDVILDEHMSVVYLIRKITEQYKWASMFDNQYKQAIYNYTNNKHPYHNINKVYPSSRKLFNQVKPTLNLINHISYQNITLNSKKLKINSYIDCVASYKNEQSIISFITSETKLNQDDIDLNCILSTFNAVIIKQLYNIWIDNLVIIIATEDDTGPQVIKRNSKDYLIKIKEIVNKFNEK